MSTLRKFLKAVSRDWGSLVTGVASIPLTVLAFWANTPLQRTAWAIFAVTCLLIALFRIWAFEYRRAEAAEAQLTMPPRPLLIIDYCSSFSRVDEETGEEYSSERVHIVNRGQAVAVNINPGIHLADRTVRLYGPLPTLGPGESIDAEIRDLRETLEFAHVSVRDKLQQPLEGSRSLTVTHPLRLPLIIEYGGLDHKPWKTEQTVSFDGWKIDFSVDHPNDLQQWTDLSTRRQQTVTNSRGEP